MNEATETAAQLHCKGKGKNWAKVSKASKGVQAEWKQRLMSRRTCPCVFCKCPNANLGEYQWPGLQNV